MRAEMISDCGDNGTMVRLLAVRWIRRASGREVRGPRPTRTCVHMVQVSGKWYVPHCENCLLTSCIFPGVGKAAQICSQFCSRSNHAARSPCPTRVRVHAVAKIAY